MKNTTFLIFFNTTWGWPADYCRQTARELSKKTRVICYLGAEPVTLLNLILRKGTFWKTIDHTQCYSPVLLPFRRFSIVQSVQNRINIALFRLLAQRGAHARHVIAWIFDQMYAPYLRHFPASWRILYDCVDYVWDPDSMIHTHIQQQEDVLIQKATWMVVNSNTLKTIHKKKRRGITVVPLGFAPAEKPVHVRKKHGREKPVIGLVGVLNCRIDYGLVYRLANKPEWHLVLQGKTDREYDNIYHMGTWIDKFRTISNIEILPPVTRENVYECIARFDVCMIPYRMDIDFNRYCYPMKLFEYFYMGKPVVATPIEELRRYPKYVQIGSAVGEWEHLLQKLISQPWPSLYEKEQRRLASENTWEKKINAIMHIIDTS
jgi:glycosyltransferase involved in cell wall biosynthesis